ncbi:MAG: DDE-type integrase/transposase/recombinase [Candidatus Caldarchaeum sp.]
MFVRRRTALPAVLYGLYLVALGLSFRCASRALKPFVDRSHVAVWSWVQRLPGFRRVFRAKCRVSLFLLDETAVMVKGLMAWVWVAYEPYSRRTLGFWLSWSRNSLQAETFLRTLVEAYGRHPVYTDGAPWYGEACARLGLEHRRYRFREWPSPIQEESMHSRACLEIDKSHPHTHPARNTTPDEQKRVIKRLNRAT